MRVLTLLACLLLPGPSALSAPSAETEKLVEQCLACHIDKEGRFDIVAVAALEAMPDQWPLQFEDAFDLDGDGVAGRVQYVSGGGRPLIARWGSSLAAARFADFALIAGAAHAIAIDGKASLDAIQREFEARSLEPISPFTSSKERQRFESSGCAACHVTQTFEAAGVTYMPLSDFLLHDLGEGKGRRTKPLWGFKGDLWNNDHARKALRRAKAESQ